MYIYMCIYIYTYIYICIHIYIYICLNSNLSRYKDVAHLRQSSGEQGDSPSESDGGRTAIVSPCGISPCGISPASISRCGSSPSGTSPCGISPCGISPCRILPCGSFPGGFPCDISPILPPGPLAPTPVSRTVCHSPVPSASASSTRASKDASESELLGDDNSRDTPPPVLRLACPPLIP